MKGLQLTFEPKLIVFSFADNVSNFSTVQELCFPSV